MSDSIESLSFELTAGALAEQERTLAGLRSRAGTVLAAASVASSFFGAKAGHGSLGASGISAMVCFAVSVGSAIWVLLPHSSFVFAFRGEMLLAESDRRKAADVPDVYRTAGLWLEPHLEANRDKIGVLSNCLTASCVMLATEVVLWTLNLVG